MLGLIKRYVHIDAECIESRNENLYCRLPRFIVDPNMSGLPGTVPPYPKPCFFLIASILQLRVHMCVNTAGNAVHYAFKGCPDVCQPGDSVTRVPGCRATVVLDSFRWPTDNSPNVRPNGQNFPLTTEITVRSAVYLAASPPP